MPDRFRINLSRLIFLGGLCRRKIAGFKLWIIERLFKNRFSTWNTIMWKQTLVQPPIVGLRLHFSLTLMSNLVYGTRRWLCKKGRFRAYTCPTQQAIYIESMYRHLLVRIRILNFLFRRPLEKPEQWIIISEKTCSTIIPAHNFVACKYILISMIIIYICTSIVNKITCY